MEIAHRWAQQNPSLSVRGYAMFAEGLTIYSWGTHFPIARWVDATPAKADADAFPARVVLFNADGYSSSTGKHKSYTACAIPHSAVVFRVPKRLWGDHKAALAYFEAEALEAYRKSARARTYAQSHRDDAARLLTTAQRYASAFGVRGYVAPVFEELEAVAAKRAKAQERAAAKARKEAERKAQERREQAAADFADWQAGLVHFVPQEWRTAPDGGAYVRRRGDNLETSQGASVPWAHAVRAFRFIKLVRERGEAFHTNGRVIRVGHFTVDEIDTLGNMRAGCHRFAWAEIERLAKAEGVFDVAPSAEAVESKT